MPSYYVHRICVYVRIVCIENMQNNNDTAGFTTFIHLQGIRHLRALALAQTNKFNFMVIPIHIGLLSDPLPISVKSTLLVKPTEIIMSRPVYLPWYATKSEFYIATAFTYYLYFA